MKKLSDRGLNYLKKTIMIWVKREDRLRNLWVEAYEVPGKEEYCRRILRAANTLVERRKKAYGEYAKLERELKLTREREANTVVMLQCPAWECRYGPDAVAIGIRYKDYEEGKLKCPTCNSTLKLKEEESIQRILDEILLK